MFLKILQQENACVKVSFLNKVADLWPETLLKKRLQHRCFLISIAIKNNYFIEHLRTTVSLRRIITKKWGSWWVFAIFWKTYRRKTKNQTIFILNSCSTFNQHCTKMKFSVKDFFSKYDQIRCSIIRASCKISNRCFPNLMLFTGLHLRKFENSFVIYS